MTTQIEKRTAAQRRAYMAEYHERRKLGKVEKPKLPYVRPFVRGTFLHDDGGSRHHLRDRSGMLMWPERRHDHPESWERTLARVKS